MDEKRLELIVDRFMYADCDKHNVGDNGSKEQWTRWEVVLTRRQRQEGKGFDVAVQHNQTLTRKEIAKNKQKTWRIVIISIIFSFNQT